nr:hypothetical protein [uncultured Arsenicibacter sp.]
MTIIRFTLPALVFSLLLLLAGCTADPNIDTIYASLKPDQAQILLSIDGKPFYSEQTTFTGGFMVNPTGFRANLADEKQSNIIITFNSTNWYKSHPAHVPVTIDNQGAASILIGKLTDPINKIGEGYLMTDGQIYIESFNKDRAVIRLEGKIARYGNQNQRSDWNTMKGLIVYRQPKISNVGIPDKALYY